MSRNPQLVRLEQIGHLILDLRLADVTKANTCREESLRLLAELASKPADDLDPVMAAQAELRYQRWAEARRSELNVALCRQTSDWLGAKVAARQAFGRAQVLHALKEKGSR